MPLKTNVTTTSPTSLLESGNSYALNRTILNSDQNKKPVSMTINVTDEPSSESEAEAETSESCFSWATVRESLASFQSAHPW